MTTKAMDVLHNLARLDLERQERSGIPEVIYGQGKSLDQLVAISARMVEASGVAIISRISQEIVDRLQQALGAEAMVEGYGDGRLAVARALGGEPRTRRGGVVGLLAAGTADMPVAEEARVMAEQMGCEVLHYYDVGIAGVHRLVEPVRELIARDVGAVVAVAGMEGALPTLVKGLLPMPVIGVPTSIGYGLGRPGEAALLTMLSSCAPGLTVVNIDNGLGAGATAALIANRLAAANPDAPAGPANAEGSR